MKLPVIVTILFVLIFLYWYIYFNENLINREIDLLHRKSIMNPDDNFSYFYVYFGEKKFGRAFSKSSVDLMRTHFENNLFDNSLIIGHKSSTDDDILKSQPVFLTALSDNHFGEGMIMLRKLFSVYNCWTAWIIYDLGLQ